MGDHNNLQTITKARMELEDLYSGVPDDSVNLTFQDLAQVRQSEKKNKDPQIITERKEEVSPLTKLPSLDFNRAFETTTSRNDHPTQYQQNHIFNHNHHHGGLDDHHGHASPFSHHGGGGFRHGMAYHDDMSGMGMTSIGGFSEMGGGRRRPGIPHSNICTVCTTYIYVFRHRCLVCGRVYCRQCVGIGMGEMAEGRKCIECMGRKFSQRYIQKAGQVGCCMGYPSTVKQQELKWAEKGPRRSGENGHGRSGMMSRSRSPAPRTPTNRPPNPHTPNNNNSNSFVMSSHYSPYSPTNNHPLPF